MLGPGVNSLLALAAQQKEQQKFFNSTLPQEGASSPSVSFGGSSPTNTQSESGIIEEMNHEERNSEEENGLQIDETAEIAQKMEIPEEIVQV